MEVGEYQGAGAGAYWVPRAARMAWRHRGVLVKGYRKVSGAVGAWRARNQPLGPSTYRKSRVVKRTRIVRKRGKRRASGGGGGGGKRSRTSDKRPIPRGGGVYSGRARGARVSSRPTIYHKYGSVADIETSGFNSMNNVNYLAIQAARPGATGRAVGLALIRYVMKRFYGQEYPTPDSLFLPTNNPSGGVYNMALPSSFSFVYMDALTPPTYSATSLYVVSTSSQLDQFASWFDTNVFTTNVNSSTRWWVSLRIHQREHTGTNEFIAKQVDLTRLRMKVFTNTELVLQNSTVSEAGSTSTDVVDSNPLVGKTYLFNDCAPCQRNPNRFYPGPTTIYSALSARVGVDGVLLPANDPTTLFTHVPGPEFFDRVKQCKTVGFQPGEAKSFRLTWKWSGYFNQLAESIAPHRNVTGGSASSFSRVPPKNKCLLIAVEKRVKGTSTITLNYHLDHQVGAVVTSLTNLVMLPSVNTYQRDNTAAP